MILITITICALAFAAYVYFSHNKIAERKAEAMLAKWKVKEEKAIREDAYSKSRAVSFGKTIEHYVPFMENFPVDPKDVQFFGKPIDYVAFSNRGSRKKCAVHFIEVKSGNSQLNGHQKNIKDAILTGDCVLFAIDNATACVIEENILFLLGTTVAFILSSS